MTNTNEWRKAHDALTWIKKVISELEKFKEDENQEGLGAFLVSVEEHFAGLDDVSKISIVMYLLGYVGRLNDRKGVADE